MATPDWRPTGKMTLARLSRKVGMVKMASVEVDKRRRQTKKKKAGMAAGRFKPHKVRSLWPKT
jgi:hypothetical protein